MALPAHLASLEGFIDMMVDDLLREILADTSSAPASVTPPAKAPAARSGERERPIKRLTGSQRAAAVRLHAPKGPA